MAIKLKKNGLDRSKFLTNLVNRDKLTPHLDRAAQEEFEWSYKYEGKEKDDAWHPSGSCVPPISELYHMATTVEEERKLKSMQKVFQLGHFWHQYMQQLILRLGFADESGVERRGIRGWGHAAVNTVRDVPGDRIPWAPYHWARGSADVAPCVIPSIGEFVVDFKTMGNHDFKQAGLPSWCADKYEAQINIYMDFFDLERALIITIQKDTPHDFKEYEFVRNQPLIDTVYQKWEAVSHVLDHEYSSDRERDLEIKELDDEFDELPTMGPVEKA